MIALVARTYGWRWSDIREMKYKTLIRFHALIPELLAREKLEASVVASFPHMETAARKAIHREWFIEAGMIDPDDVQQQRGKIGWKELKDFTQGKPVSANPLLNVPKKKE